MQHEAEKGHQHSSCHPETGRTDWLLWVSLSLIVAGFFFRWLFPRLEGADLDSPFYQASLTIVELMQKMAWGLVFAILFVGLLDFVPRSKFRQVIGKKDGLQGILRATLGGVLLDLCSHGILLVGMKVYERGASLGQTVAFLIASPWNSLSMTIILWSLIGLKLTIAFIVFSCVIAVISGLVFESLVRAGKLPDNPNREKDTGETSEPWFVFPEGKNWLQNLLHMLKSSFHESKMILRWIFFGVLLTALVKELISPESFKEFFGPDTVGVLLTLVSATVLEVCSEGSAPLASEFVTTAKAPGNAFTFLMAGVSTDYTEIMALKETTRSWKIAFFLPLVTLPQIVLIAILMNKVTF